MIKVATAGNVLLVFAQGYAPRYTRIILFTQTEQMFDLQTATTPPTKTAKGHAYMYLRV